MSESECETDFEDEDLSAPPRRDNPTGLKTEKPNEYVDETADEEEGLELPVRTPVKRKQDSLSPKVDKYSPIVRRQAREGAAGMA